MRLKFYLNINTYFSFSIHIASTILEVNYMLSAFGSWTLLSSHETGKEVKNVTSMRPHLLALLTNKAFFNISILKRDSSCLTHVSVLKQKRNGAKMFIVLPVQMFLVLGTADTHPTAFKIRATKVYRIVACCDIIMEL